MKKKIIYRILFSLLVVIVASCTESESDTDKIDKAVEDVHEAKQDLDRKTAELAVEVEAYRESMQRNLEKNRMEIARLKDEKIQSAQANVIRVRNEKIAQLEQRNDELEARMKEFNSDSKENWEAFKREFKNDMDELGDAFRDIGKDNVK
ncbi:hypothetical protein [Fluviicola taffensis]|uniref:Peptidase M23 n=1 Tax=Fluviicola taffensis (strain DSM 16823 / NCIMB 13979 / RW262) TaxID=755732 RepID=F2IK01_FLUTR|nr:hypothetical protein [Fluviicola taffensis]AEA45060.1 peptidase M23 [Fluviicola taffensis DSM 16823]